MLTPERIKKLQRDIRRGVPGGEIKNQLEAEGHSSEDIQKVFTPKPYDMRTWLLVSAVMVFLFGMYLFVVKAESSYLIFILSGLLFYSYYREDLRKKREEG